MGVWIFTGVIVGLFLWHTDIAGALIGGVIAWLLWQVKDLKSQLHALNQQLVGKKQSVSKHTPSIEKQTSQTKKDASPKHQENKQFKTEKPAPYCSAQVHPQQVAKHTNKKDSNSPEQQSAWGSNDGLSHLSDKITPILTWFVSGNMLVRMGSVVLFFGAGFLLKYAAEHSQLSIEVRMLGIVTLALGMLGAGWYLRSSRMIYALALQGGGLGLLYLTIFASFRLYDLLPASMALILLAVVSASGVALAVVYNARWLAILSFAGGFLAPILASTGTGSHVALFSWYAVLNVGIAVLAWFKAWRSLNLLGMVATFIIVVLWGNQYYQEVYFYSVEPFLVGFGLMYLAVGVLFSLHRADPEQKGFGKVDASIIFGTPVGFFLLQTPLVHHFEHGMSLSALLSGLVYMSVAWLAHKQNNKILMMTLLSIGGALLTLAIPLEFDETETAAAWAMEGVGLLWLGLKQKSSRALATGIALQVLAVGSWLWGSPIYTSLSYGQTLSAFLIALSAWACAFILGKHPSWQDEHTQLKPLLVFEIEFGLQVWGIIAWVVAGLTELHRHFDGYDMLLTGMAWVFASAWLVIFLGERLAWSKLKILNQGLIFACCLGLLVQGYYVPHPAQGWGWLLWLFALPTTLWMLYISDKGNYSPKTHHFNIFHIAVACFILFLFAWEIRWQCTQWFAASAGLELWQSLVIGLLTSLLLICVSANIKYWPMNKHAHSYLQISASIYVIILLLWMIWEIKEPVQIGILFIPLFNPLDIVIIMMALALFQWFKALQKHELLWFEKNIFYASSGMAMFVWLNTDIARVVHHYFDIPWTQHAMFHAVELQAALSIVWSLLALLLMLMAGRHHMRYLWMIGAVLLSAVVFKLFTIDMSGSGTLARIISFLGVGGLFLIIGYFTPLPPSEKAECLD